MTLVDCPCGVPAEVVDEHTFASTDGPVVMRRLFCAAGHIYDIYEPADAVD